MVEMRILGEEVRGGRERDGGRGGVGLVEVDLLLQRGVPWGMRAREHVAEGRGPMRLEGERGDQAGAERDRGEGGNKGRSMTVADQ